MVWGFFSKTENFGFKISRNLTQNLNNKNSLIDVQIKQIKVMRGVLLCSCFFFNMKKTNKQQTDTLRVLVGVYMIARPGVFTAAVVAFECEMMMMMMMMMTLMTLMCGRRCS